MKPETFFGPMLITAIAIVISLSTGIAILISNVIEIFKVGLVKAITFGDVFAILMFLLILPTISAVIGFIKTVKNMED
jgi:hypothetical protein